VKERNSCYKTKIFVCRCNSFKTFDSFFFFFLRLGKGVRQKEIVTVGSTQQAMPGISLASVRKQLELELAGMAFSTPADEVPEMECLRSPTTRTLIHIMKNRNSFDIIKQEFDAAKKEEAECQEIADEAEKLRAEPLIKSFAGEMKKVMASMEHPIAAQAAARAAASGDAGNSEHSADPPAEVSLKQISAAPDADPDDVAIAEALMFSQPRDDAGVVISMSARPSLVLASRNRTPHELAVGPSAASTDLQQLLREQRAMREGHEASKVEYENLLKGYAKWQGERRRIFDVVLES
jgi:hypothetical protein